MKNENCTPKDYNAAVMKSLIWSVLRDATIIIFFQMIFNLKNTVSQFKRLIGRKFSDPIVAEERKRQTCVLVEQPGNSIGVKVILGTAFVSQQR